VGAVEAGGGPRARRPARLNAGKRRQIGFRAPPDTQGQPTPNPPNPTPQPTRSCKSPQMMLAAVIKSYFATAAGKRPADVVSCSIMPCVRKQGEADREWFATGGAADGHGHGAEEEDAAGCDMAARDLDHVITTAELGKIFQEKGINLAVGLGVGPWGLRDSAWAWQGWG
jgi:hypothetical protein